MIILLVSLTFTKAYLTIVVEKIDVPRHVFVAEVIGFARYGKVFRGYYDFFLHLNGLDAVLTSCVARIIATSPVVNLPTQLSVVGLVKLHASAGDDEITYLVCR